MNFSIDLRIWGSGVRINAKRRPREYPPAKVKRGASSLCKPPAEKPAEEWFDDEVYEPARQRKEKEDQGLSGVVAVPLGVPPLDSPHMPPAVNEHEDHDRHGKYRKQPVERGLHVGKGDKLRIPTKPAMHSDLKPDAVPT
jgi:hypothetical protein